MCWWEKHLKYTQYSDHLWALGLVDHHSFGGQLGICLTNVKLGLWSALLLHCFPFIQRHLNSNLKHFFCLYRPVITSQLCGHPRTENNSFTKKIKTHNVTCNWSQHWVSFWYCWEISFVNLNKYFYRLWFKGFTSVHQITQLFFFVVIWNQWPIGNQPRTTALKEEISPTGNISSDLLRTVLF